MFKRTPFTLTVLLLLSLNHAYSLKLKSTTIAEGKKLRTQQVMQGFGCNGKNLSPDLSWSEIPQGTKSFAITLFDPDAPTTSGWWHWFVFNIPANVNHLIAGSKLPTDAITLRNDYGKTGFGGACPPPTEMHRYQFTIHALDTKLDLASNVSNALASFMIHSHTIESSTITAVYVR